MKRPYYLAYIYDRDKFTVVVRSCLSICVLVLVIIFSLTGFVNGRNGWFVGTNDIVWNGAERGARCRARLFSHAKHLGYHFEVDACEVNCIDGETYIGNPAGATSSLFFFLVPLWGCVVSREMALEILLAWAHFSSLAISSFFFHGTKLDVYWRLDRTLCYLFALPYLVIELMQLAPRGPNGVFHVGLLGSYALGVSLFATETKDDAVFDTIGSATSYTCAGVYFALVLYLHHKDTVRMIYFGIALAFLLAAFLLLNVLDDFCYGDPWLGNLALGHLIAVPGFTVLLASHFLGAAPPKAETPPAVDIDTLRSTAMKTYQLIF